MLDSYKTQVTNYNNAQSGSWLALINGYDNIAFKLKSFTLPSITSGTTEIGGGGGHINLKVPGDHTQVGELVLEFFVDEFFDNYISVVEWINMNNSRDIPIVTEITLYPIDTDGNIMEGRGIIFKNAWPITIAELLFDSENSESDMFTSVIMSVFDMQFEGRKSIGNTEF